MPTIRKRGRFKMPHAAGTHWFDQRNYPPGAHFCGVLMEEWTDSFLKEAWDDIKSDEAVLLTDPRAGIFVGYVKHLRTEMETRGLLLETEGA